MLDGSIRQFARWTPRATAVFLPDRDISYATFDADIDRLGAALADLGLTPETGCVSVAIADPYLKYLTTASLSRLNVASAPAADNAADLRLSDREPGDDDPPALEGSAGRRRNSKEVPATI